LLAISTSTERGSVCLLHEDGRVAGAAYVDLAGHAERLFAAIDEAVAAAGIDKRSIDRVACDVGPGSFTGLRVGVSAGKGIALALGAKLSGAGSLEAMAEAAFAERSDAQVVVACLDAKKGEVFLAAYTRDASNELTCVLSPRHVLRASAAAELASLDASLGLRVGAGAFAAELFDFEATTVQGPEARWVAVVAARREALDPALLEPAYVRAPDATLPAGQLLYAAPR
jgi:tRNA threonylcarbamoyladenosine biosynthesis protein TsaB